MTRNTLDQETSPYLLQHKSNPVHWQAWGPAALAQAKAAGKPVLLSVGYAACHWCHVMAHESFEDEDTARLINELYLPIKVDREERPDIDIIYQSALANLGQQGGWPLTMFLTPDGEPFWGGTYFPPAARFGRPSFRDVLVAVATIYRNEPEKITTNVGALKDSLRSLAEPAGGGLPDQEMEGRIVEALHSAFDPIDGGLSGAPKFPQISMLFLLWRAGLRQDDRRLTDTVLLSLDKMSLGGLYDHLGGGYARYSTDRHWLVPHFEKMLYDNAQLIEILTSAWQRTRKPLYARRIAETIGWLSRDMLTDQQAFAATLDADSEGEEGKYYVWQEAEIDRALPPPVAALFKDIYGVGAAGNWEGRTILHRNHPHGRPTEDVETSLAEARATLLALRDARVPPGRDDKALADWNGMMIAALARAAFVFDRADWLAHAETAFAAICRCHSADDRLSHSWRQARRQAQGMLDDYAQMARAALILYETTGTPSYLDHAAAWVAALDRHYWDDKDGGYFFTADDAVDVLMRTKSAFDHATPSGNAVMVEVLARLFHQTGKARYRDRAETIMRTFGGQMEHSFPSMAALLNAWDLLGRAVQVVLVGHADGEDAKALRAAISQACLPNLVFTPLGFGQSLMPDHPAQAKVATAGDRACAFVCVGPVCSLPLAQPGELRQALERIN